MRLFLIENYTQYSKKYIFQGHFKIQKKSGTWKALIYCIPFLDLTEDGVYEAYVSAFKKMMERKKTKENQKAFMEYFSYLDTTYLRDTAVYPPNSWSVQLAKDARSGKLDLTNNNIETLVSLKIQE